MVERFFSGNTTDNSSGEDDDHFMLLSGPPSCGKTSLLFQFAFNAAVEGNCGNRDVVFICTRRRLESKPPYLSQGVHPSSEIFHRIQMKYVEDNEAVKKYFAAFHLHHKFPVAVIIDDFGDFFDDRSCRERHNSSRGRDLAMVRTLALCHSAILHAKNVETQINPNMIIYKTYELLRDGFLFRTSQSKTAPCKVLLSDTHHGDSPRLLFIYKRWIPSIFTIKGDYGSGTFVLTNSGGSGRRRTAKYSIALQHLFLEEDIAQDNQ